MFTVLYRVKGQKKLNGVRLPECSMEMQIYICVKSRDADQYAVTGFSDTIARTANLAVPVRLCPGRTV